MPLHTTITGDGDPVVLLHSGGMSSRQWRRLAERLAATHRAIAPDFLGSGKNEPWDPERPFDLSMDVDAIGSLLEDLRAPAHLVGHSYGGMIALTLARTRPELVRSIAVYDPVAFGVLHAAGDREGLADLSRAEDDPIFTSDDLGGSDRWFESFVDYWQGAGAWRALPEPARASFLSIGRKVYYEVRSLMGDRTPASAYAAITSPALLMHGALSPPAARRVVALLGAALPNARVVPIEGAGHMGPITHADVVDAAITEHVARS